MNRQGIDEKANDFVQAATNSSIIGPGYHGSDEFREDEVSKVFRDFMSYAMERYSEEIMSTMEPVVADLYVSEEKWNGLRHNLLWWWLFYESSQKIGTSMMEEYITENDHWLSTKPILISLLRECDKAIPKFYFIGYEMNEKVFIASDILTGETIEIVICYPLAIPPKKGEIVLGTLIPLGDGSYFPIMDFYQFDLGVRQEIAHHLHNYYDQHLNTSPMHDVFIYVLTAMLQVERFVFLENQGNAASQN
jgi:hypothetical protein